MKYNLDFINKDNWPAFRKFLRWVGGLVFMIAIIRNGISADYSLSQAIFGFVLGLYLFPPTFNLFAKMLPKSINLGNTFNRISRYAIAIGLFISWMHFSLAATEASPSYQKLVRDSEIEKQKQEAEKQKQEAEEAKDNLKTEAYLYAKDYVKAQLKYPEEADFPWRLSIPIVVNGDTYKVQGYVNTKNGFGVKIKAKFVCVLKYTGYSWEEQATTVFE